MMVTANLELSKELYELSGWDDTSNGFMWCRGVETEDKYYLIADDDQYGESNNAYPAYDLGYLLRKLPGWWPTDEYGSLLLEPNTEGINPGEAEDWSIGYYSNLGQVSELADTPEDCAAKLCILLFKQGILTAPTNRVKEN